MLTTLATIGVAFFFCWVIQLFPAKHTFHSYSPRHRDEPSKVMQAAPFFLAPILLITFAPLFYM